MGGRRIAKYLKRFFKSPLWENRLLFEVRCRLNVFFALTGEIQWKG